MFSSKSDNRDAMVCTKPAKPTKPATPLSRRGLSIETHHRESILKGMGDVCDKGRDCGGSIFKK